MVILPDLNDIGNIWECSAHIMSHQGTGLRVQRLLRSLNHKNHKLRFGVQCYSGSRIHKVKDSKSQRFCEINNLSDMVWYRKVFGAMDIARGGGGRRSFLRRLLTTLIQMSVWCRTEGLATNKKIKGAVITLILPLRGCCV